jgi:hypothetical protein
MRGSSALGQVPVNFVKTPSVAEKSANLRSLWKCQLVEEVNVVENKRNVLS